MNEDGAAALVETAALGTATGGALAVSRAGACAHAPSTTSAARHVALMNASYSGGLEPDATFYEDLGGTGCALTVRKRALATRDDRPPMKKIRRRSGYH